MGPSVCLYLIISICLSVYLFINLLSFHIYRRVCGERWWRWPVSSDEAQSHHSLEILWDVPELCRPPPASSAPAVPAPQTLLFGGHRLLARLLDIQSHHSQNRRSCTQLLPSAGKDRRSFVSEEREWLKPNALWDCGWLSGVAEVLWVVGRGGSRITGQSC